MNDGDRKVCAIDRRWAAKRVNNIYMLLAKVKKDDAFLFEKAAEALRAFSSIPDRAGDEAYSTFLAVMANRLAMMKFNKVPIPKKPQRKTSPRKKT